MSELASWSYFNPVEIRSGSGSLTALPSMLRGAGAVLIVVSAGFKSRGGEARIAELLAGRELHWIDDVTSNPDMRALQRQLARIDGIAAGDIVAIGGGSVLDTAKILAVLAGGAPGALQRHLFDGVALPRRSARLVCIPTTAGTGAEVTPFATVWDLEAKRKHSLAGESMFPDVALLDPELTLTLTEDLTVSTGLDALTQAFEATWSRRRNPVSTAFAVRAIQQAARALPSLVEMPHDLAARAAMLEASLLAGLAISRTRTTPCHSISYPLTAHLGIPHGLACAFTLAQVITFNREPAPALFEQLAQDVGTRSGDDLVRDVETLLERLQLSRRVREFVTDASRVFALVPEMLAPGRADNNLRAASADDVSDIVRAACRAADLRGA